MDKNSCLKKAAEDLAEVYGIYPQDGNCCLWGGIAFGFRHAQDHFRNAVRDFTSAIRKSPLNLEYYYWRGQAYHGLEEYEKAILNYNVVISIVDAKDEL